MKLAVADRTGELVDDGVGVEFWIGVPVALGPGVPVIVAAGVGVGEAVSNPQA